MSITDELMWRYYELLSFRSAAEIADLRREVGDGRNPRDAKVMFAQEIVARFHGAAAAEDALADFEARFKQGAIPDDIQEVALQAVEGGLPVVQVLRLSGLTASTSEAMRMIAQGGVKIDGEKVADKEVVIPVGASHVLQVGKRKFARVTVS